VQAVTAAWVLQGRGVGLGATREAHEFGGAGLPYRVREAQVSVEGCPLRGLALVDGAVLGGACGGLVADVVGCLRVQPCWNVTGNSPLIGIHRIEYPDQ